MLINKFSLTFDIKQVFLFDRKFKLEANAISTFQGLVVSFIFFNIYLHELDEFIIKNIELLKY